MGTCLYTFTVVYEGKKPIDSLLSILICTSVVLSAEEEEENGPGFSRLHMRLIAVEFHGNRILLRYFRTLVMLKLTLCVTLSVDLLAAHSV